MVGIEETSAGNIFSVYPNPAGEELNLKIQLAEKGSLIIYSTVGEKIMMKEIARGEKEIKLYVKNISSGIYFVQVKSGHQQFSKKIIIQ